MKKIIKKSMAIVILAVIMISTLAGCSQTASNDSDTNTAGGASSDKKVTLTIEASQAQKTNTPEAFSQENIDAFEEKYPHIKVEVLLVPDGQATTTLQTKLAAGEPSDILVYNKVSGENELNVVSNMVDLSNEPWVERLNKPDDLKSGDGKIYGFKQAVVLSVQAMVYNKDIFEELNLNIPTSYEELLQVSETIKEAGITPIYAPFKDVWTFQIWTAGPWSTVASKMKPGLWDDINSGKVKWTDVPEFADILQKGLDLYNKGYMQESLLSDDYNGAPAAFSSKEYAMMIMGDWFINDVVEKDPNLNLGLFPVPAFDDSELNVSQGQLEGVYFIPKKAKHIEEAKLFIDFMSQKDQMDRAQSIKPFIATVNDASQPELTALQQEILDKYISTNKYVTEMNAFMKVDLNDLWKYYQDMFAGTLTPEEVLSSWDSKFAELMEAKDQPGF